MDINKMRGQLFLGIDIGSASTEGVLVDGEGQIISSIIINTKPKHSDGVDIVLDYISKELQEKFHHEITLQDVRHCIGTGYGRGNIHVADESITEITCHARGAYQVFPYARTIMDIGGQDSKVIRIDEKGEVVDFIMNDKCAAGTGRFLELAGVILNIPLEELGAVSVNSKEVVKINSTCVVFARAELLSKSAEEVPRDAIVKGMHEATVQRLLGMGNRIGIVPPIVFTGGVAENIGILDEVRNQLHLQESDLLVPPQPKIIGAFGAALLGLDQIKKQETAGE